MKSWSTASPTKFLSFMWPWNVRDSNPAAGALEAAAADAGASGEGDAVSRLALLSPPPPKAASGLGAEASSG